MRLPIVLFLLVLVLSFSVGSLQALKVNIPISTNYSEVNTNYSEDSGKLEGRNTASLVTYIQGLYDLVYCKLTGCTMAGDIQMQDNDINGSGDATMGDFIIPDMNLNNPTFNSLDEAWDLFTSAGTIDGGAITDNGDQTVSVAGGNGTIRIADDDTSQLKFFVWDTNTSVAIPTDSIRYIGVEYNAGSPRVTSKTTNTWNYDTEFPLGSVINLKDNLYPLDLPWQTGDAMTNVLEWLEGYGPTRDGRVGGLILGYTGTRNPTVTASNIFDVGEEFPITAKDCSGADTFYEFYRDGGTSYNRLGPFSAWNNTHWDDGSGTLQELDNNQYANIWVFMQIGTVDNGKLMLIFPQNEYPTSALAESEEVPTFPPMWYEHGILIGRILIKEGVDAPIEIQSAFTQQFTPAQAADHGNLAGLTDDDHTQYLLADGSRALTGLWNYGSYNFNGTGNFISTGTVQAEHLYSTDDLVVDDDLTVSGVVGLGTTPSDTERLKISLVPTQTSGIYVDGSFAPFATKRTANYGSYINKLTNVNYDEYTSDTSTYGAYNKLTVQGVLSGIIGGFANYLRHNAGANELTVTGAHTASFIIGAEEINVGLNNKVTRSGTLTNFNGLIIRNYGSYNEVTDNIVYNKAANTLNVYDSIVKAKYIPSGSASAGTMNRYAYLFDVDIANSNVGSFVDLVGIRVTSSGSPFATFSGTTFKGIDISASQGLGATTGYGIYLGALAGTAKWGYYNNVASAHNLLGLDNVYSYFGTGNDAIIYYDGTNMIFNTNVTGNGIAYFSSNVSASDFIDRTSVYDKTQGNSLDFAKDSSEFLSEGIINHSKYYGRTTFKVTDFDKPEDIEDSYRVVEYTFPALVTENIGDETITYEKIINQTFIEKTNGETGEITTNTEQKNQEEFINFLTESNSKGAEITYKTYDYKEERTIYPYKKLEEGVSMSNEMSLIRQQIYDLKEISSNQKLEIELLKSELCKKDNSYVWCINEKP